MAERTPSLQEILYSSFDYFTSDMYTMIPGIVLSVHPHGYVDVQPTLDIRNEDGDDVSPRPPSLNVPIVLPTSLQGGLEFPVAVGDTVALMFSMRGLDTWKRSDGKTSTPTTMRKFDKRDCIAVPGLFPINMMVNQQRKHNMPHSKEDVVLVHNRGKSNEVEIRLTRSGDVRIRALSGKVYVDSEAHFSEDVTMDKNLFVDGIHINTHRHTNVEPGPGQSGEPV